MTITLQHQWFNTRGKPCAIPHVTTKNTSFLRTCSLLKRMGIKNFAFPLTLYDPDLKNVDVYALEDDTPENEILRTKVIIEARRNGWYFLRECIRIYEQGGSPVPFRLDRGSCAMAWCFFNGIDYTGMQPRQTGKAQPRDAKILTTHGWQPLNDISFDTRVVTPDGGDAAVVGIYGQGVKDIYRFTLSDGSSTEACDDHQWQVYSSSWPDQALIMTTREMRQSDDPLYIQKFEPGCATLSGKRVMSIEFVGQKDAMCIEIDDPNHLYVTDDYIVTHNTVCALSLTSWVMYSSGEEFQVGMMAKDNSLRQENVKRVKAFGENLPKWWLAEDRYKDKKNAEELFYAALRTHYVTFVGQAEKSAADKAARGASPPMFHFDEFEFTTNIGISYPTILASTGTARENAKKNNKPHSNLITTTAGDPNKPECREAARLLEGAMPFTERLYDIESHVKLHEIVQAASPQKMIIGVFSHLQLGYDNKWLRDKIARNRMTRDQVLRDYLNRRVSISEDPVIPANVLATITASEQQEEYIEIVSSKFVIYWYIPEHVVKSPEFKQRSIVVGCDSSEMIGRDATTLVGIDPKSLETIFTFRCSEGNINVLGMMIGDLLLKYPNMVWVPENKSSGTSLIDNVSLILTNANHNPFMRIFNWVVNNRRDREFAQYDIRDRKLLDTSVKRFFGIKTDKGKRDELYSKTLLEAASLAAARVKDKTLIQELSSLTVRNGRVDHAVGGHDDTVVAWLMAVWFILNGRNLDVYGIKPGTALSFINPGQPDKSKLAEVHQMKILKKIEELEQQYKLQPDAAMRKYIQGDIILMRSMIDSSVMPTPTTADEFARDPRKYTDRETAESSRPQADVAEIEGSLRLFLGLKR